jgi:hypothetical protein
MVDELGGAMSAHGKKTLIENTLALALMGILAGVLGGLAIGVATSPKGTSTTTSTSVAR